MKMSKISFFALRDVKVDAFVMPFCASVVGISGTLSFSQAKNICLKDRKC